ncbi:DEAD/DEAH box helicase [Gordonia alkaliphila]|uniref:DEAD/DEAH box helicase n=1 Tax=Gordonia alkaliphila TaxID=1053547 RepID=UPI001FF219F0|nr:DEAD/DEAH box helicase [Gordonia alkaliphila]MCK0437927.1 DEAD/DEAH box helicase [Gordonia alkaliphila]
MVTRSWSAVQAEQALSHLPIPDVLRGRGYAKQDRISAIEWTSPTVLRGICRGSGANRYQSTVTLHTAQGQIVDVFGVCSCPVAADCKHCAALILAAVDTDESSSPWRALLREVSAEPAEPTPRRAVALQFHVSVADALGLQVALRPVVQQPDGTWTPHLPWAIVLDGNGDGYDDADFRALAAIASAFFSPGSRRTRGVTRLPAAVALGTAPAALWTALRGAVESGLPVVVTGLADDVVLTDEFAVAYRVQPHSDGAALTASLTLAGDHLDGFPSAVVGLPKNGAALLRDHTLYVGALPQLTTGEAELLSGGVLEIPTADFAEFSAALPELTARRSVEVPERGLLPPEVSAPFPLLLIEVEESGSRVRWRTGYLVDGYRRDFDPSIPERTVGLRDVDAEAQMWQRARPDLELFCGSLGRWNDALTARTRGRLRAERVTPDQAALGDLLIPMGLNLADTAVLCAETVARITAPGLIEVEITGATRDFRPADTVEMGFRASGAFEWLDLSIDVLIDGEPVPLATVIDALARDDDTLVLTDGAYFRLDTPELLRLKELLDEARAMGDLQGARIATGHPNATLWDELLSLGSLDTRLEEWRQQLRRLTNARPPEPVPVPDGLDAELRGYQRDGLDWLSFLWDNGIGGILADDMGLGKTVQTLALMTRAVAENPQARFLVVAPTSVIGNWAAETTRFAPGLRVATVTATQKRAGRPLAEQIGDANVVITSYTLLRIDSDAFTEIAWDGAVFDEAQFIKNHNSKTHQAARKLSPPFKLAITGTPMENNVMELWSLVSVVMPGLYASPQKFREHFAGPIESGTAPDRLDVLRRRLKPIMLRRTKDQVAADLPPKQDSVLTLQLSPKHRKLYDLVLNRERQRILGLLENWQDNRVQILQALTRMRQLSLHPGLVNEEFRTVSASKIDYLAEHLPILLDEGHSALVFSSFTGFLQLIAQALTDVGITFSYLDGSMSARKRQAEIDKFTGGETKVFLISLKAGGFGLNLTAADYCFVADPWWNPAAEAQAVDRAHRIGQERPVTVYRLVSAETIEERVIELQDRKRALFDALIDDGEQFSGKLSADDVRRLIADDE